MDLELDGEPRNRTQAREDSPHATRWRVGEQEIVADLDVATNVVHVRVADRAVGDLPAQGGSLPFTLAAGSGYRGGEQVEARIHRDARTDTLTLWASDIEVQPTSRPARPPTPTLPRSLSHPHPRPLALPLPPPPPPSTTRWWVRGILLAAFLVFLAIPTYLYGRPAAAPAPTLEEKTQACLRRADEAAAEATKRLGNDPKVDDQRRLARIACKQHEIECKRDPRGFICLMDPK